MNLRHEGAITVARWILRRAKEAGEVVSVFYDDDYELSTRVPRAVEPSRFKDSGFLGSYSPGVPLDDMVADVIFWKDTEVVQ